MKLGEPLTPFTSMDQPTRDIRGIQQFFDKNKQLKLIIVVVPDRGSAYSELLENKYFTSSEYVFTSS